MRFVTAEVERTSQGKAREEPPWRRISSATVVMVLVGELGSGGKGTGRVGEVDFEERMVRYGWGLLVGEASWWGWSVSSVVSGVGRCRGRGWLSV